MVKVAAFYGGKNHCNHPRLNFHWLFRAPGRGFKLLVWHLEHARVRFQWGVKRTRHK